MQAIRAANIYLTHCRLCATDGEHQYDILNAKPCINDYTLREKIFECLGVRVSVVRMEISICRDVTSNIDCTLFRQVEQDDETTKLCEKCYAKINEYFSFRDTCATRNINYLLQRIHTSLRWLNDVNETTMDVSVKVKSSTPPPIYEVSSDEEQPSDPIILQEKNECADQTPAITCITLPDSDSEVEIVSPTTTQPIHTQNTHSSSDEKLVFKCARRRCGKFFENLVGLLQHQKSHQAKRSIECRVCKKIFVRRRELAKHMKIAHRRRRSVICPVPSCRRIFRHKSDLNAHTITAHTRRMSTDSIRRPSMVAIPRTSSGSPIRCVRTNCQSYFESWSAMEYHLNSYHASDVVRKFECYMCHTTLGTRTTLQHHMNGQHSGQRLYICPYSTCSKTFYYQSTMLSHYKRKHSRRNSFPADTIQTRLSNIHANVATNGDRRRISLQCQQYRRNSPFESRNAFEHHVRNSHKGDAKRRYECYLCHQSVSTRTILSSHMNAKHIHRKRFRCPVPNCRRFFYNKRSLRCHLRSTHTISVSKRSSPEALIKCAREYCKDNYFTSIDALNHHLTNFHAKKVAKSYECHLCKRQLSRLNVLKTHIRLNHIKMYGKIPKKTTWRVCESPTSTGSVGVRMQRIEIAPARFVCPAKKCSAQFRKERYLDEHMTIMHARRSKRAPPSE